MSQKLLIALLGLAFVVAVIASAWQNNVLVTSVLALCSAVMLLRPHATHSDRIAFVIGAIIGPVCEAILTHAGAWHYANPTIIGIPAWLPLLWGMTIVVILKIVGMVERTD